MKADLMPFGFIIGGPNVETWVATREEIDPKIKELGGDPEDYTATEVFAKIWRGEITHPFPTDWEHSYKNG